MKRRMGVALTNTVLGLLIFTTTILAHGEDNNPVTVTRSDWIAEIPTVIFMIGLTLLVNYYFIAQIRRANKQAAS